MALIASLTSGVSALRSFQRGIEVIGNNIANVNTTGFKSSRVEYKEGFNDILNRSATSDQLAGQSNSTANQIGTGVLADTISGDFGQGPVDVTGVKTDLGITGEGFFKVVDRTDGSEYLTRAGNFRIDDSGYLVTQGGHRIQGLTKGSANFVVTGSTIGDGVKATASASYSPTQAVISVDRNQAETATVIVNGRTSQSGGLGSSNITFNITNGGSGYPVNSSFTFNLKDSGTATPTTDAVATATTNAKGEIESIAITTTGSGYTNNSIPDVVIPSPFSTIGSTLALPDVHTSSTVDANGLITVGSIVFTDSLGNAINTNNTIGGGFPKDYEFDFELRDSSGLIPGANGTTGTAAIARAKTNSSGKIVSVSVITAGSGYTPNSIPSFKIPIPGQSIPSDGELQEGDLIFNLNNAGSGYKGDFTFNILQDDGSGNSIKPTGSLAIAHATVLNGQVQSISITKAGSGYTVGRDVKFTIPKPEGALYTNRKAEIVYTGSINNGIPNTGFNIINGGAGYTEDFTFPLPDGAGTGTPAIATASVEGGKVVAVSITTQGFGYTGNVNSDFDTNFLDVPDPTGVNNFTISEVGSGYDPDNPPSVTIGGDGIGASGKAVVNSSGEVVGVYLDKAGTGFSKAELIIGNPPANDLVYSKTTSVAPVIIGDIQIKVPGFRAGVNLSNNTQTNTDPPMKLEDNSVEDKAPQFKSFSISPFGDVEIFLTNGDVIQVGKILLQRVNDPQALIREGDSLYTGIEAAGLANQFNALEAMAGTNGLGIMKQGALELSNVDLTESFAHLITTQRSFQGAARIITTSDEILQEVVNLKR